MEASHISAEDEGNLDNQESTDKIMDITDLIDSENLNLPLTIEVAEPPPTPTIDYQEPAIDQNAIIDITDNLRETPQEFQTRNAEKGITPPKNNIPGENSNYYIPLSSSPIPGPSKILYSNILTPFKKLIFWPSDTKVKTLKRQKKEKIPAVASSKQWQDYFKKKEENKNEDLQRKNHNQEDRKKRRLEKEEQKKTRIMKKVKLTIVPKTVQNQKKVSNAVIAEDGEEMEENNSTGEGTLNSKSRVPNENGEVTEPLQIAINKQINTNICNTETESIKYAIKSFVIVNYNETLFPGKIIGKRKQSNSYQYEVNHMEKHGLNWIWANFPDILWYNEDEIQTKINEPVLKNKRGLFSVKELSDFS